MPLPSPFPPPPLHPHRRHARYEADLAIADGRIAKISNLARSRAQTEIDCTGKIVAPGFIDAHTHDDRLMLSAPGMAPKVSRGVSTVAAGNCGVSLTRAPNGMPRSVASRLHLLDVPFMRHAPRKEPYMHPRISMITLGVRNLSTSINFYEQGLGFPRMDSPPEVAFFTLNGTWLGLYGGATRWPPTPAYRRRAVALQPSRSPTTSSRKRKSIAS